MRIKDKLTGALSSELNKRIFNHSFWILAGNVLSKSILLLATILMTRFLGKEEYGYFGIIKSTILTFVMFTGLELGLTATKYISQYKDIDKTKVEKIVGLSNLSALIISILISILIYVFADDIALEINAQVLSKEIRISSFILFFSSLNGIQNGILAGLEQFKKASINNVVAGIISSLALIFSSKYYSLEAVVVAFGSNFVILFLLNYITLKKVFYSKFRVNLFERQNFDEFSVLWKFSLPAILAGLVVGPVAWFCNYLLVNQLKGYEQMANFDIANQWRNTILFIPSALAQIVLPLLASSAHSKSEYNLIFEKNLKINIYLSILLVIVFVFASPLIIHFYGRQYDDALMPMIVMFITTGFVAVNNVVGQAIASQGKMWLGFVFNLIWGLVLIVSAYLFILVLKQGAWGLSIAYLISYIVHTILQFCFIRQYIKY
ncbi:oligosaccharide flippase family protein [Sphingobacterium multivorum]|uniref:oligosaccharide flippase family protein n=1 Tax=Sphingobacterium multivorum TaxID=28454 RepID=UPI002FDA266C